jgi:hypothetical protein
MSIPVGLDELAAQIAVFGSTPYLLTVSDEARAHAVSVAVSWANGGLTCSVGRRTAANAASRPDVSLLWPPHEPAGYSLIVDGLAEPAAAPGAVTVRPQRAVLHRSAASPDPDSSCTSDCVPIDLH